MRQADNVFYAILGILILSPLVACIGNNMLSDGPMGSVFWNSIFFLLVFLASLVLVMRRNKSSYKEVLGTWALFSAAITVVGIVGHCINTVF